MDESSPSPATKLEDLAQDAAKEGTASGFMNPGAKSKRGRPKGSKSKSAAVEPEVLPPPNPEEEREALKPVLRPVFSLLSMAGVKAAEDERAALSPEQQEMMTHTSAGVVVKYMPGISTHADLICLTLMMGQWGMTVWMLRRENLERMRREHGMNGHAEPVQPTPMMQ